MNGRSGMHDVENEVAAERNLKLTLLTRPSGSTSSLSRTFQGGNTLNARHLETTDHSAVVHRSGRWQSRLGLPGFTVAGSVGPRAYVGKKRIHIH